MAGSVFSDTSVSSAASATANPKGNRWGDVRLPDEKVLMILHCLVEGNSVRGTARLCDVEKKTVLRILKAAGENCEQLLQERIRNVRVKDVQLDEAWTFVLKKERRKRPEEKARTDIGDQYVFIAIERHSKLIVCWHLGRRDVGVVPKSALESKLTSLAKAA